jgi:large subunit ribosomal protein L25
MTASEPGRSAMSWPRSGSSTERTSPPPREARSSITARATLAAEHRELTGKKVARLRHAGRLPAVVYGHGVASDSISIDAHEFEQLRRHTGPNAMVDLSVDGAKAQPVLVSSVQVHPVNRRALHVDLFLVRMTEELTVDVPLSATGESTAVTLQGGTLLHPIESVKVRALPDHLPQVIEYPVESLVDFDTTLHVRDLVMPEGVTLVTDGDEIIAKVQPPRVEEAPVVAAVAEGEEGAEGEAAAEGGTDESAGGDES